MLCLVVVLALSNSLNRDRKRGAVGVSLFGSLVKTALYGGYFFYSFYFFNFLIF